MTRWKRFGVVLMVCGILGSAAVTNGEGAAAIKKGSKVAFNYTLSVDGNVAETTEGRAPLAYTHGSRQIVPGLEKQLEGMRVGEEKKIIVKPAEAYGAVDANAFKEIEKKSLPKNIEPKQGMFLQGKSQDGQTFVGRIKEVKKDTVRVDFNHSLAGKTLNFDVKIVSVE